MHIKVNNHLSFSGVGGKKVPKPSCMEKLISKLRETLTFIPNHFLIMLSHCNSFSLFFYKVQNTDSLASLTVLLISMLS